MSTLDDVVQAINNLNTTLQIKDENDAKRHINTMNSLQIIFESLIKSQHKIANIQLEEQKETNRLLKKSNYFLENIWRKG